MIASKKISTAGKQQQIQRRRWSISRYEIAVLVIIAFVIILRLVLIARGWPETNSDEGSMGIEAMHIAFLGKHPIFLYGQDYMGVLEAYIAALMFHLFGVSVFSLRLGMILLFTLFLISTYLLTSLLYTKKLAVSILALLSLGTVDVFIQQLRAVGGAVETLLFGSLIFLLGSWLALKSDRVSAAQGPRWHLLVYGGWGFVAGIGLWSHQLVAPFVLMGSLILVLFCWPELKRGAILFLFLGLLIGAFPLIYYNLKAQAGHDTLTAILQLHSADFQKILLGPKAFEHLHEKQIIGTMLYTLPVATGLSPICSYSELPLYTPINPHIVQCIIMHGGWSLSYIVLVAIAIFLAAKALWKLWHIRQSREHTWTSEERQAAVLHVARLMLLLSAVITLALYISSPLSGLKPWSTRYLVGLLIITPAVIWPIWKGIDTENFKLPSAQFAKFMVMFKRGILLLVSMVLLAGTFITFSSIPSVEATNSQQEALIHDLLRIGATHIYSDYWTCDRLIFQSREQIICSVLDQYLQPALDRYMPYRSIVRADHHAAYVFAQGTDYAAAIARRVKQAPPNVHYREFTFDGFVIYQPVEAT